MDNLNKFVDILEKNIQECISRKISDDFPIGNNILSIDLNRIKDKSERMCFRKAFESFKKNIKENDSFE